MRALLCLALVATAAVAATLPFGVFACLDPAHPAGGTCNCPGGAAATSQFPIMMLRGNGSHSDVDIVSGVVGVCYDVKAAQQKDASFGGAFLARAETSGACLTPNAATGNCSCPGGWAQRVIAPAYTQVNGPNQPASPAEIVWCVGTMASADFGGAFVAKYEAGQTTRVGCGLNPSAGQCKCPAGYGGALGSFDIVEPLATLPLPDQPLPTRFVTTLCLPGCNQFTTPSACAAAPADACAWCQSSASAGTCLSQTAACEWARVCCNCTYQAGMTADPVAYMKVGGEATAFCLRHGCPASVQVPGNSTPAGCGGPGNSCETSCPDGYAYNASSGGICYPSPVHSGCYAGSHGTCSALAYITGGSGAVCPP